MPQNKPRSRRFYVRCAKSARSSMLSRIVSWFGPLLIQKPLYQLSEAIHPFFQGIDLISDDLPNIRSRHMVATVK